MAISTLILLAGVLVVAALLCWQFRFTDTPEAEFRSKRARILWIAAALSVGTAYGHMTALERERPKPNEHLQTFSGPEEPRPFPPPPAPAPPPPPGNMLPIEE